MEVLARFTLPFALAVTLSGLAAPCPGWALGPDAATTGSDPEPRDPSSQGEAPEPGGLPTTASPGAPPPPPAPAPPPHGDENWLDIGHAFIEHRIFAPVLRVDRFFSDERQLEPERARSFLQWRQELRFQQHHSTPAYTTTVGANLKLPGLNAELRKLQVEITGQTRDAFTALFPGDHASPGEVPTADSNFGKADAGIGYRLFETVARTVATHGDLGAGVTLSLPPGVYGRARIRFAESLGASVLARQAVTGFWRTDTGFGSGTSAELERPLAFSTLARLGGSATITEKSRGVEWGADLSLAGTLRSHIGAQLGFGLSGASRAPVDVDVYRLYLRLRRDLYRKWIFVELAPEYAWPWEPLIGRRGVWAIVLRLEVQFQGNEAPRVPAPDDEARPEPADPAHPGTPSALPAAPAPG